MSNETDGGRESLLVPEILRERHPYRELWLSFVASALEAANGDDTKAAIRQAVTEAEQGNALVVSYVINQLRNSLKQRVTVDGAETQFQSLVRRVRVGWRQQDEPSCGYWSFAHHWVPGGPRNGRDWLRRVIREENSHPVRSEWVRISDDERSALIDERCRTAGKLRIWRKQRVGLRPSPDAWRLIAHRLIEVFARELTRAGQPVVVNGETVASAHHALLHRVEKAAENGIALEDTQDVRHLTLLCNKEADVLREKYNGCVDRPAERPVVVHEDVQFRILAALDQAGGKIGSRAELANAVNAHQSTVSKELGKLRTRNLVDRKRKKHAQEPLAITKKGAAALRDERQRLRNI